jgi:hypothetical protein
MHNDSVLTRRAILLVLLTLLMPSLASCTPCKAKVGNLCYDQQDPSMPALRASWQLLDAETGKGIPGAWISLRWQGITPRGQRTVCERAELGVTDQDGRFSTVGKDGAARIYHVSILAPGYEELRFEKGNETLLAVVPLQRDDLERYAPWVESLQALGYRFRRADTSSPELVKDLAVPPNFNRVFQPVYHEDGNLKLMVTRRALPTDPNILGSVALACNNQGAELIGYDGESYTTARLQYRKQIYERFCDTRWNTQAHMEVDYSFESELNGLLVQFLPSGGQRDFLAKHAPHYLHTINQPASAKTLMREERTQMCSAILALVNEIDIYNKESGQ